MASNSVFSLSKSVIFASPLHYFWKFDLQESYPDRELGTPEGYVEVELPD